MNTCYICGNPIDPERFICYDCSKSIIQNKMLFSLARGNGKTFISYLITKEIIKDLDFYNERRIK